MRFVALLALGLVSACGSADGEMSAYKQQTIDATPTKNAVAASNTFHFCKPHPQPDRYAILCEACDVTVHVKRAEGIPFGLVAYASVMEHDLKVRDGEDEIKISRSFDAIDEDFRSDKFDAETARDLFSQANDWCQSQADGEFQILKDEIDLQLGEGAE